MTKRELVNQISEQLPLTRQDIHAVLQKTLDGIAAALARGDTVEFRDFGVFEVRTRRARLGRNPHKPEDTVTIPPRRIVKFKAGKAMKNLVLRSAP